jgi:hypothetical protein
MALNITTPSSIAHFLVIGLMVLSKMRKLTLDLGYVL